jgi:hypothetical protein
MTSRVLAPERENPVWTLNPLAHTAVLVAGLLWAPILASISVRVSIWFFSFIQ